MNGEMSASGTKRTSQPQPLMSAFGDKADMPFCTDICPLMTQSGHRVLLFQFFIDLGRPLEFHGMHDFITIEWVYCRCRRVSENISFDFAKAYLLSSGPHFIPTQIKMMDHSIGIDSIGSGVSKHRVVKRELLLGCRHKSNRFFAITFQNKHHHALGTIDDPAARVGA